MKAIELNTATVDNAGHRIEAGSRVSVGSKANQIEPARAKELVGKSAAKAIRETKAPAATAKSEPKKSKPKTGAASAASPANVARSAQASSASQP